MNVIVNMYERKFLTKENCLFLLKGVLILLCLLGISFFGVSRIVGEPFKLRIVADEMDKTTITMQHTYLLKKSNKVITTHLDPNSSIEVFLCEDKLSVGPERCENIGRCRITDINGHKFEIFMGDLTAAEEVGEKLHQMTGMALNISDNLGSSEFKIKKHVKRTF
jgi:hypothetical protein